MKILMHKEHTSIYSASFFKFKPIKVAEIKVKATIRSNTKQKSFFDFPIYHYFHHTPPSTAFHLYPIRRTVTIF